MKIITFIVCDDIRHEMNNKKTLVGVYDDQIIFYKNSSGSSFPIDMKIGLYLKVQREKEDPKFNYFRMKLILEEQEISRARGELIYNDKNLSIVFSFVFPVKIEQSGLLKMEMSFWLDKKKVLDISTAENNLNFYIHEIEPK